MSQPSNPAPIVEIIPVSGGHLPAVRLGSGLTNLVEALNPLGTIGKAIVEVMAYSTEMKRLAAERERVMYQAQVLRELTNAQLQQQLEKIDIYRQAVFYSFQHAETVLHERRVTRQGLVESMRNVTAQMGKLYSLSPLPGPEHFQFLRDMMGQITSALVEVERQGTAEIMELSKDLHKVVQQVHHDMQTIPPITYRGLPPSS